VIRISETTCEYCWFSNKEDLRKIQLKDRKDWQRPIKVCPECRKYLVGKFRYVNKPKG
jgi:hypothetical protein